MAHICALDSCIVPDRYWLKNQWGWWGDVITFFGLEHICDGLSRDRGEGGGGLGGWGGVITFFGLEHIWDGTS